MKKRVACVFLAAGALIMSGCSMDPSNVQAELAELSKDLTPSIKPLPKALNYTHQAYSADGLEDPFSPSKMNLKATSPKPGQPDMARKRHALESFGLESLKMLGTLEIKGQRHAIIKADGNTYNVRVGQFMGFNHGQVVKIEESGVGIRESYEDADGKWSQKEARLNIEETNEVKK